MAVRDNLRRRGNGGSSSINGLLQQYKVSSGGNISAGDFVKFVNSVEPDKELTTVNKIKNGEIVESQSRTGMWAWRHPHQDGTVTYTKLAGDVRMFEVAKQKMLERGLMSPQISDNEKGSEMYF